MGAFPFTKENGATHVVLGSHRDQPRGAPRAHREPTVQAEMQQGSALIWTGWSVHGAGANTSSERRIGMNINYSLGFLAQEENQLLACPPHLARHLPESLQRLIGYRQPAGALNYVAECQACMEVRPSDGGIAGTSLMRQRSGMLPRLKAPADSVLKEDFDVLVPGAHGHDMHPAIDGPGFAPRDEAKFAAKLDDLEARKARAIADDELELALHLKRAISVLRRSPRL